MSVVKRVMLLLLLVAVGANAAPSHEGCEDLNKTIPVKDLHKVYGHWVLVWSVSQNNALIELLENLTSSHVELHLQPDNHTIEFHERNMFHDKSCMEYNINISIPSEHSEHHHLRIGYGTLKKDGTIQSFNDTGDVDFYETGCADCMVMAYRGVFGHFLMIYKRDGQHNDAELLKAAHSDHKKQAECLGFPHDKPFIYDGAADFCHKKSSPAVEPEQS